MDSNDVITESWRELADKGFRCNAVNACRSQEGIYLRDAVIWVDEYIAGRNSHAVS